MKKKKSHQLRSLRKVSHSAHKELLREDEGKKKEGKTLVGSENSIGGVKME